MGKRIKLELGGGTNNNILNNKKTNRQTTEVKTYSKDRTGYEQYRRNEVNKDECYDASPWISFDPFKEGS